MVGLFARCLEETPRVSGGPSGRELTESRSEIVFEALPIDDPQVRQPDIVRAKQLLGWEPEIDVREGLRRTIEHYTATLGVPALS
jgi:nucleoside-diphosphate-sugar epimerase